MIWNILSLIIQPKYGEVHAMGRVTAMDVSESLSPITGVHLIAQPESSDDIGFQLEYTLPKYCVSHYVKFEIVGDENSIEASFWLEVDKIKIGRKRCLMNSLNPRLAERSRVVVGFCDNKLPTCNNYEYEVFLKDHANT